jgi:hypothetical protein
MMKNKELVSLKRYVNKIEVFLDESRSIHVLKMYFSLPIVNDKLIWKDKSNKKLGYDLLEGRDVKLLFLKKKREVESQVNEKPNILTEVYNKCLKDCIGTIGLQLNKIEITLSSLKFKFIKISIILLIIRSF